MKKTLRFMGMTLYPDDRVGREHESWKTRESEYSGRQPFLITVGNANDGTWFVIVVTVSRCLNFGTSRKPSMREALETVRNQMKLARDVIGKLK